MMDFILVALNFFLVFLEIGIGIYMAEGFFERRLERKYFYPACLGLIVVDNVLVALLENIMVVRFSAITLVWVLWLWAVYRARPIKSVFVAALWLSISVIVDILVLSVFPAGTYERMLQNPYAYYAMCYAARILQLLVVLIVRTWAKTRFRNSLATWTDWLRVLILPLVSVAISYPLGRALMFDQSPSEYILVSMLVLLGADLATVFLLSYLEKQNIQKLENAVLRQNLKLEYEHILALKEAYAQQRKQTHDFQNQLAVLRGLADKEAAREEFIRYLDTILATEFPSVFYVDTHRLVIDVILSQKHAAAKSRSISLRVSLDDLADFPLPDDALVVVLTNLLDNAMEACEKVREPERRSILLKMHMQPDAAYLYVENTVEEPVTVRNNRVQTTKGDRLAHGYGLKNVYAMLDRHGAIYAIDYREQDRLFCFSAQLPRP